MAPLWGAQPALQLRQVNELCFPPAASLSNCLAPLPCGCLALSTDDRVVAVLQPLAGGGQPKLMRMLHFDEAVLLIASCATPPLLAVATQRTVQLFAAGGGWQRLQQLQLYFTPRSIAVAAAAAPPKPAAAAGGQCVVAVGGGNGVELYELSAQQGGVRQPRELHEGFCICVLSFSPCGRFLLVATLDSKVGIWDLWQVKFIIQRAHPTNSTRRAGPGRAGAGGAGGCHARLQVTV